MRQLKNNPTEYSRSGLLALEPKNMDMADTLRRRPGDVYCDA